MPGYTNKAYCINCGEKCPYEIKTAMEEITIRGTTFSYSEQTAFCSVCGEEIYVPEINDLNAQAREDSYRRALQLITETEIREILEKYNIGAGPLAKLMGLGEVTITRYLNGQLPSRDISAKLFEIKSSHKKMEAYLESGKDKISPVAYQKCHEKIEYWNMLCGKRKIEIVARYILCQSIDITPMALQKLLYYAQAFYHAIFKEDLFLDECQAWAYGPVFPDVYHLYKAYGYDPIDMATGDFDIDIEDLSSKEIELIDSVIESFGKYSGSVLSRFTHKESPWIDARGTLKPTERSNNNIARSSINRYFDAVITDYSIVKPQDIDRYSEALLRSIRRLG